MKCTEDTIDQKQRDLLLKQLVKIERAAHRAHRGAASPASVAASLIGVAGSICGALLGSSAGPFLSMVGGLAGFFTFYWITLRKTKLSHSWGTEVYLLLATYEPVYVENYRRLQEQARDGIDTKEVLSWVELERAAIIPPVAPQLSDRDRARRQFTDRQI